MDKLNARENSKQGSSISGPSSCLSDFSAANTTAVTIATTTAAIVTSSSSSTFPDNLALSRLGPVEISFQPHIGTDFSQAFPDQFQPVPGEKDRIRSLLQTTCDSTITNGGYQIYALHFVFRSRKTFSIIYTIILIFCRKHVGSDSNKY